MGCNVFLVKMVRREEGDRKKRSQLDRYVKIFSNSCRKRWGIADMGKA